MKKGTLIIFIVVALAACRKTTHYQKCTSCVCVNKDSLAANRDTLLDSATFYQSILGTWYVREFDTFNLESCASTCFCDSFHPVVFLNDSLLIMHFPGVTIDTFSYQFASFQNRIDAGNGYFYLHGNPNTLVLLSYYRNYMLVYTQTQSIGTVLFPPNYILSRH
jgi:hypothetical protein